MGGKWERGNICGTLNGGGGGRRRRGFLVGFS